METLLKEDVPGRVRFRRRAGADIAARIARFASPATRLLLAGDGLTTTSLQAWAGGPMRVLEAEHGRVPRSRAPAGAAELLEQGPGDVPLLLRRSLLAGPGGRVWSANVVVAGPGVPEEALACLRGDVPLGQALQAAGLGCRRTLADAGSGEAFWAGGPAAFRCYVLRHRSRPLAVVCESFNPRLVDARTVAPGREDAW
ncbi:hypothetical protein [Actinomadura sp. 21ATH]|uniref:hypothetical protein n=1 Tax=Actinomadura sp. 21ATH TaxID=1735444 RepID=UPI0035C26AB9